MDLKTAARVRALAVPPVVTVASTATAVFFNALGSRRALGARGRWFATLLVVSLMVGPAPAQAELQERIFPAGSGIVDVKAAYGAKGDGKTDDTQAIQRAISENLGERKTLYFPRGTYLIKDRLEWRDNSGEWGSGLALQGQSRDGTVIKLEEGAPGYSDPASPKAMVYTASSLFTSGPYAGGKDHPSLGEGNEAFGNYVEGLTIDAGQNRGAMGIDYLANNHGAVRDVTIRGQGTVGLSVTRKWPGPCLIKDVRVEGFDYGIAAKYQQYGITLEHIGLAEQRIAGIHNEGNALSIRDLSSDNAVPAIQNTDPKGLVILVEGDLEGGKPSVSAVESAGPLFVRDVATSGYLSAISHQGAVVGGSDVGEFSSGSESNPALRQQASLGLPVEETPEFHSNDLNDWANIADYGAVADDWGDDSVAIQKAIDSGKSTIYFPSGRYFARDTIRVRGSVRKIAGMNSLISPTRGAFADASAPQPLFRIEAGYSDAVIVERMTVTNLHQSSPTPGLIAFEQVSSKALVLKDIVIRGEGKLAYRSGLGAGPLFLENVYTRGGGGGWRLEHPQNVWARQLDAEGGSPKLWNGGARLWVLGIKTEGESTAIETHDGGETEILGGVLYPVGSVPAADPAFVNAGSQISLSYATVSYADGQDYDVHVRENAGGVSRALTRDELPTRGLGRAVPLFARTVDTAKPSIFISRPAMGSRTRDRTPTISVTVNDAWSDLGRADIGLYVDGRGRQFDYSTRTDRLVHSSRKLPFGRHSVSVAAADEAGLRTVRTWSFEVAR